MSFSTNRIKTYRYQETLRTFVRNVIIIVNIRRKRIQLSSPSSKTLILEEKVMPDEIYVENVSTSADPQYHASTLLVMKALDERNVKYEVEAHNEDRQSDRILIMFRAENMPGIRLCVYCNQDNKRVSMFVYNLLKLPNAAHADILQLLHTMHKEYIFGRWVLDERDSTIQVEWYSQMNDTIDSARIIVSGISRMACLVDESYPTLVKTCAELGLLK